MVISQIKSNPNNPRLIKDDKFKQLCQSIKDLPKMMELRPIVVDENNIVQGGNMRLKALQELGYKEIPDTWIKQAKDFTPDELKEFIIKDNVGFGEWNWDQLANEWDVEQLQEWGLDIPDFALNKGEATEDDYEIPDEIETDIVLGDLFEIGQHRLLCGDSTNADDVARLMNGQKADMVFTDPPYNALKSWNKDEAKSETRLNPNKWFANDNMEWDDFVLDLFLGSGTTMVAAHQLNRKCYGMELDPKYCQVIVERMRKHDPNIEIKRNGELLPKE